MKDYLKSIDDNIKNGVYKDTWLSLSEYQIPRWYKDAKFGLFSHYGVYSVTNYNSEWYSRNMYVKNSDTYNHHLKTYGNLSDFGYKKFIEQFRSEKFSAKDICQIVKNSGAKYYIPVAEHHDGFAMYETKFNKFNAKKMGPKIDIIKELKESCDIAFGVSSHRAEHFFFMAEGQKINSDIKNPEYGDLYWPSVDESVFGVDKQLTKLYLEDWLVRCCELVDLFHPKIVYFDWWIEMPDFMPYLRKFLAYFYNKCISEYGYPGVCNYKHDAIPYLIAVRDVERGQFEFVQHDYWQCCTSIASNSWSYTDKNKLKSHVEIIQVLIDVVSKNGNLLLNFCPHPDGNVVKEEIEILSNIGKWLKVNAEGIYGTHPWKVFGEGDTNVLAGDFMEGNLVYRQTDFRFTQKANYIYVFIMQPSGAKSFRIVEFGQRKRTLKWHNDLIGVQLLGSKNKVTYDRNEDFMQISFEKNLANVPCCVRFEFV